MRLNNQQRPWWVLLVIAGSALLLILSCGALRYVPDDPLVQIGLGFVTMLAVLSFTLLGVNVFLRPAQVGARRRWRPGGWRWWLAYMWNHRQLYTYHISFLVLYGPSYGYGTMYCWEQASDSAIRSFVRTLGIPRQQIVVYSVNLLRIDRWACLPLPLHTAVELLDE